jgi:hypothetical protein
MSRGNYRTHSSQRASHQSNGRRLSLFNMVALKNQLFIPYVIFFNILVSPFSLTEDNKDILNHFIDFMTCEIWWRTRPLSLTIDWSFILVFHWNVASMSHVHHFLWFTQILIFCFYETMWTFVTYSLALSWQVTCRWRIINSHKQNSFKLKVLTLVLIRDLHSIIVTQHLQIFNQRPEISVDVIPRLLWP